VLNRRGGPNKQGGLEDFFVYYMKNNGEGGKNYLLLHENQGEGVKISEIE
jgi:hypothetical protein